MQISLDKVLVHVFPQGTSARLLALTAARDTLARQLEASADTAAQVYVLIYTNVYACMLMLQSRRDFDVSLLRARDEAAASNAALNAEMQQLRTSHRNELEAASERWRAERAKLAAQAERGAAASAAALGARSRRALETLTQEHMEKLSEVQSEHAQAIEDLKREHQTNLRQLKQEEAEMAATLFQQERAAAVAKLQEEAVVAREAAAARHKAEVHSLNSQVQLLS